MKYLKELNRKLNLDNKKVMDPLKHFFRELPYIDKQAVEVYDRRDILSGNPNNNVIITCEHASNKTHAFRFPPDEAKFLDTHWGYDIGAKDMGLELAEKAKLLSVFSNFSRLIIDPNRSILCTTLVRSHVEKDVELTLNRPENVDIEDRIRLFYLPYYRIMRECLLFIKPRYAIGVHSFTPQYEDHPFRDFELGILYRKKGKMVNMLEEGFKKHGIIYRLNEPYSPDEGVCYAMESLMFWNLPDFETEAVLLEFRNDHCSNPKFRNKIVDIMTPIVNELNKKV